MSLVNNLPNQSPRALPSSTARVNISKALTAFDTDTVSALINLNTACPYIYIYSLLISAF